MRKRNHYPKHVFSLVLLIPRIMNPPTNQPPTTYPATHQPPTQRLTESIIIFERFGNRSIFILQNTARKTYTYTSVYYPKGILVSIITYGGVNYIYFFWFSNSNALLLPRYFKVTFFPWIFFQFIAWVLYSFMR